MAFYLMSLLAENKQEVMFGSTFSPLKLLGDQYDRVNGILIQFLQFLKFQTDSYSHYNLLLPKNALKELCLSYKIQLETALAIVRYSYKPIWQMNDTERLNLSETLKEIIHESTPENVLRFREEEAFNDHSFANYHEIEKNIWNQMTPEFFSTFWILNLDDIYVPQSCYTLSIEKLQKEIHRLEEEKNPNTDSSKAGKSKVDKEIERLKSSIDKLKSEQSKLIKKKEALESYLDSRKSVIFEPVNHKLQICPLVVQLCFYKRMLIDPSDAFYCVKFMEKFHKIKKVKLLTQLENLTIFVMTILPCLQCFTEREAFNVSVFFSEIFAPISTWKDDDKFKRTVIELTGNAENVDFNKAKMIILSIFQRILKILRSFNSDGYMQARNALIFLEGLREVIPCAKNQASMIFSIIDKIKKDLPMEDLKLRVETYEENLKKIYPSLPDVESKSFKDGLGRFESSKRSKPDDKKKDFRKSEKEKEPREAYKKSGSKKAKI